MSTQQIHSIIGDLSPSTSRGGIAETVRNCMGLIERGIDAQKKRDAEALRQRSEMRRAIKRMHADIASGKARRPRISQVEREAIIDAIHAVKAGKMTLMEAERLTTRSSATIMGIADSIGVNVRVRFTGFIRDSIRRRLYAHYDAGGTIESATGCDIRYAREVWRGWKIRNGKQLQAAA